MQSQYIILKGSSERGLGVVEFVERLCGEGRGEYHVLWFYRKKLEELIGCLDLVNLFPGKFVDLAHGILKSCSAY